MSAQVATPSPVWVGERAIRNGVANFFSPVLAVSACSSVPDAARHAHPPTGPPPSPDHDQATPAPSAETSPNQPSACQSGAVGGFNWWSQHLECEELRWQGRNVDRLIGRCVRRCGRLVARRGGVVSIRSVSGKVLPAGSRARKPAWRQDCLLLSERAGSGRVAGCNRSRLCHCRAVTCPSPNARRSPS